jgi:N-acetylmuramoyl-L-alanine amidase
MAATLAQARTHHSQAWAEEQFNRAESQREALNARAEQARTRREYETVIASYRELVLNAPTSSKADDSAFQVAQLTAEMGRHFKDEMALYSSIREYKFLRREYPGSRHRMEALLAIGEIYKNDLDDQADAHAALEEFLQRYHRGDLVKEARAELAGLNDEASAKDSDSGEDDSAETSDSTAGNTQESRTEDDSEKLARVTSIEHRSAADYTQVTINLQQDVQFEAQRIAHPDRIFFDLKNTRVPHSLNGSSLDVDDGRVNKIRIAQYKPGRARIVIETTEREAYTASLALNPPRLLIDVHGAGTHPTVAGMNCEQDESHSDCPQARTLSAKNRANVVPEKVIVAADDTDGSQPAAASSTKSAPASSRKLAQSQSPRSSHSGKARPAAMPMREAQPMADGDRSLIRTLGLKIGKIVIDPGHGGHDTGTIGPHGLLEKDLVLDVSKRLGKLLQARLGAQVVFTRRDDTFIPLETRTAIANQEQADLFVSVHANSSHDPDARGVETYYLNFTSSPEALEVAARENAASDKSIHELQDLVKKIALKEKIEESREFASDVQQSLHNGLAARNPAERNRGVKKAPFVVLIGANMPSILAEISFLSNPSDEIRLRTPAYRQRIAESLYRGIDHYINSLGGLKVASRVDKTSAD